MFDHLEIKNFKSVEHLELSCRRVNVLIGEPNTGKSNILEALGLISYAGHSSQENDLRQFVRCDDTSNLFYDGDLSRAMEITLNIAGRVEKADYHMLGLARAFPHSPSIIDSQTDDSVAALLMRESDFAGDASQSRPEC